MARYVEQSLSANEHIVYRGQLHWIIFFWPIAWTVITFGFALPVTAIWLLLAVIRQQTTDMAVTNKRVVAKTGLIARHVVEQRLAKIDAIRVQQGVLGRMLGYGNVIISGSGLSGAPISAIADPLRFKRMVDEQVEQYEQANRQPAQVFVQAQPPAPVPET